MATMGEIRAAVVEQVRRLRLEEKRLRSAALGYGAGQLDVADLVMAALRYEAAVRAYQKTEDVLHEAGGSVPKAVRDGDASESAWESEVDTETTQPCRVRQGQTLQ